MPRTTSFTQALETLTGHRHVFTSRPSVNRPSPFNPPPLSNPENKQDCHLLSNCGGTNTRIGCFLLTVADWKPSPFIPFLQLNPPPPYIQHTLHPTSTPSPKPPPKPLQPSNPQLPTLHPSIPPPPFPNTLPQTPSSLQHPAPNPLHPPNKLPHHPPITPPPNPP